MVDKVAGIAMMLVGLALGLFAIPPVSLFALLALLSGGLLFVGGIHVLQNPSASERPGPG